MAKRFNGGVLGKRIEVNRGILSLSRKGKTNGGITGKRKLFSNLDNAVNQMGGIWGLGGVVPKSHGITTSYQELYWVYPSAYQVSTTLGPGDGISGTWNPHPDTCFEPYTTDTGMPGSTPGVSLQSWNWVNIGTCPWTWAGVIGSGYFTSSYWVYPSPYQQYRTVYATTYYTVWDYF